MANLELFLSQRDELRPGPAHTGQHIASFRAATETTRGLPAARITTVFIG